MSSELKLGVDVGGTKTAYGIFDETGKLIAKGREPTDISLHADDFLKHLAASLNTFVESQGRSIDEISGIGIGMPGYIRQPEGYIITDSNIPNLAGCAFKEKLENIMGRKVILDNDTHAAALAESRHGAGVGYRNMIYCAVSSGIASAMIINGELFSGSYGFSGESGHMLITPDEGIRCDCGKQGCFMSWCSGIMIVRHIKNWIENGEKTRMTEMAGGEDKISCETISKAASEGDEMALRAIEQMQHYLSLWLFNLYIFTNINCFVLGGGLVKMGNEFWDEVFRRFRKLDSSGMPVYFKFADLKDDTGIIGAYELLG
jgi:glucokinase